MQLFVAVFVCAPLMAAAPAQGDRQFPYTTTVAAEDVYVRSGPGQNYYPTDKLKRGQEVEVYRHDPGGWCAIRPVDGSFAWVSGRFLKPTERRLAVVTEEGVSARVGSRFSDVRDVVQVRLHKGETVEVIEAPSQDARGSEGWYKIAPPAGEFRWVASKYLDDNYARDGLRKAPPPGKQARDYDRPVWREDAPAERPQRGTPMIPAAAMPDAGYGGAEDEAAVRRPPRHRTLSPEEFSAELARIELELSLMVIEEPTRWSFDALRQRTDTLLDQSQTAVERGQARLLANKIARFDDIKQRQDAVLAMRDDTDRSAKMYARLRPSSEDRLTRTDSRFDGVGKLTQVVSPKTGAPRYALIDKSGKVQCYVTPAPGVPLRNFVGQEVGLNGTRGYVPEQKAGHIMARHVTPLEGTMVR